MLSYFLVRLHWAQHGLSKYARLRSEKEVSDWELQIFGMIGFILCIKSVIERLTLDLLLGDILLYFKGAILTLSCMVDPRVCVYFSVVFLLIYLLAPQPYRDYTGPNNTTLLTLASFNEKVLQGRARDRWLVLFFTPGKVGRQVNRIFASMSLSYADEKLQFGRVNAEADSDIAAYADVSLAMGAALIMYTDGQETCRLPEKGSTEVPVMNANNIAKVFHLDRDMDSSKKTLMTKS